MPAFCWRETPAGLHRRLAAQRVLHPALTFLLPLFNLRRVKVLGSAGFRVRVLVLDDFHNQSCFIRLVSSFIAVLTVVSFHENCLVI